MAGPIDRGRLHGRTKSGRRSPERTGELESEIDSLLVEHERRCDDSAGNASAEVAKSPMDQLRDAFTERLTPVVEEIAARYREKGISVSMDPSDFLGGGRNITIEVAFGGHRTVFEGTVMSDVVAFSETRYAPNTGGAVVSGPTISVRRMMNDGLTEFIYKHIAALVRASTRSTGR